MKPESQETQIINHLRQGKTLTALEALNLFDCWALSQRITRLKRNWPIHTKMITTHSGKRIAKYELIAK